MGGCIRRHSVTKRISFEVLPRIIPGIDLVVNNYFALYFIALIVVSLMGGVGSASTQLGTKRTSRGAPAR
jgi:hypothetical protein